MSEMYPLVIAMKIRKQVKRLLMLPLLGVIAAAAQAQLGSAGGDLGGSAQGSVPCDDRFFLCPGAQSMQTIPGASPYNSPAASPSYSGGRNDLPEADTRYDFGNGQPLNLSQRDYPYQRQAGGPPLSAASPVRFRPEPLTE